MPTPLLTLAMIVKDEEETLARCLGSVQGVADEIVIVDTGSTDKTKAIAAQFGATIHDFVWIDDFAAARNFAFSKAAGQYVMWLDGDDEVLPADREKLLALKSHLGDFDAYLMEYNYAQDEFGNPLVSLFRHRIVRNSPPPRWNYPIHECMAIPGNWRVAKTDIVVTHRRTQAGGQKDAGRNLRILSKAIKAMPDDQRMKYYYGKELFYAGKFVEAITQLEAFVVRPNFHDDIMSAYDVVGQCYLNLKNPKKAVETCYRAIEVDPRWVDSYMRLGNIYYDRGEWAKAAHWYEIATKTKPADAVGPVNTDNLTWSPYDRLCKCYAELGRLQEAHGVNDVALRYRPGDRRMLENRAYLADRIFDRLSERPIRLNLGGGQKVVASYRNCDLFPGGRVEFVFDQCKLPYNDSTVHAIYSEHALEHAPSHDAARDAIKEWKRALRRGGHLVLKVPDLDLCCTEFLRAEDRPRAAGESWTEKEWYRYTIYGIQKGQGTEPDQGQYHRTGFTKPELKRLLEESGFRIDYLNNYDGFSTPSIEVRATQVGKPARIRWLVRGRGEDDPSTRIRRINVSRWLSKNGADSSFCESYRDGSVNVGALLAELRQADVVVFAQFSKEDIELAGRLNRCGVSTVYDMNEDLSDFPDQQVMLDTVKCAIFCSTALQQKYGRNRTSVVITDAYETPAKPLVHSYGSHGKDGKVRVLWSGMGGNAKNTDFLRPICQELGMEFLVMSEWPSADIHWKLDTWLENLNDTDIVVSPQWMERQPAKSNTKVTQAMALGLPVVASPMLAYQEAIKNGETGFLCQTPEEWRNALMSLRDSEELRHKIGTAAQESVKAYDLGAIGMRWAITTDLLCSENCNPPKVDIIIPTYNNLPYLQACIESIRKNTDWPHNIIVINSGTDGTAEWLRQNPDVIALNSETRLHFSAANNVGLKISFERYVCLLNDDTLVTPGWLGALMHEAMKPGVGAVGCFSNCDQGWLHNEAITVAGQALVPGMSMDQVKGIIPEIYKYSHRKEVHPRDWVAFYCTLIPRGAIDQVGFLDENFKSGDEDVDYCRRLVKAGYVCRQTYDSFVFHFGGRTRKLSASTNTEQHQQEDRENHAYLHQKWSAGSSKDNGHKKVLAIHTGPAWERWSPKSLNEGGIGGSETCAVHVAREFVKKGWQSVVFGDCSGLEGLYDGVEYVDHARFPEFAAKTPIDLFIASRRADVLDVPMKAARKVVWAHDIWLEKNPEADIRADKADKYFVLSPWHRKFFLSHHRSAPADKVIITRDGVDLSRFGRKLRKIPGRMVYSSSPDRGLETLLDLLPAIRKEVPEAELHIFYGFDTWEKSAQLRGSKDELETIARLRKRLNEPGVIYRGRVGQDVLAQEFQKAELWAYPTWFTETFCITACEAMAAGTPIVTTDVAALETTVGDAGVLVPVGKNQYDCGLTGDPVFQATFTQACIRMLTDRAHWEEYSKRGLEKAKIFSWEGIVEEWLSALDTVPILAR